MNRTILLGLIIMATAAVTAMTTTTLTYTYASSQEAPCSPPIDDPDNEGYMIERCAGEVCSINKETGERTGCVGESAGLTRICPEDESDVTGCIVTTP